MCNAQAYYRKLHRIPEQSGHEHLTSKFISQALSEIGYEPRQAGDTPPLHNSAFYVPENILPKGASMWVEIASHDWKGVLHNERA